MLSAAQAIVAVISAHRSEFFEHFRLWSEMVDYDLPCLPGLAPEEADKRSEDFFRPVEEAEQFILRHRPFSGLEVSAMLKVVMSREWMDDQSAEALETIQAWLALGDLKSALEGWRARPCLAEA